MATVKVRSTTYYNIAELNLVYGQGRLDIFLRNNDSESYMMDKISSNNIRIEMKGNIKQYVDESNSFVLGNITKVVTGENIFNDGVIKQYEDQKDKIQVDSTLNIDEMYYNKLKEGNTQTHQRGTVIRINGNLEVLNKCGIPIKINGNIEQANVIGNIYVIGEIQEANVQGTVKSTMKQVDNKENKE